MRFYQQALQEYRQIAKAEMLGRAVWHPRGRQDNVLQAMRYIRDSLEDLNTQRILFDARQATTFADLGTLPPLNALVKVRSPFPTFYLEFTEPIMIGDKEPGYEDFLRAVLFNKGGLDGTSLSQVTVLLTNSNGSVVDRTFKVDISTGQAYVQPFYCADTPDPSEFPESYQDSAFLNYGFFPAGTILPEFKDRHIGWWERMTQQYAEFLSWVLLYMMAKGISIVEQRLSRKERKQLESKKAPVKPWHMITVEPQISQAGGVVGQEGRKHSYRYDVMGHLRFGNHHIKDTEGNWTRKRTVEWVSAHQRGVQNIRYVPAVRRYKSGKETHPVFKEYMEGGEA